MSITLTVVHGDRILATLLPKTTSFIFWLNCLINNHQHSIDAHSAAHMAENPATTRLREYLMIRTDHPTPDYKGAVAFLKKQAKRIGLPAKVHSQGHKPIVVITWKSKNKALQSILLNSHMDVVPAYENKWTQKPFAAFKSHDGKIYGRGAQDMKSTGISYLEAVDGLKREGFIPNRTIHIMYTPDQELGGNAIAEFLTTPHFKALNIGFALDKSCSSPKDAYLVFNEERANWALNITCHGTPSHGSMLLPNNAADKVRIVMNEFEERRQRESAKLAGNPLDFELGSVTSINLTMLDGGLQRNCVPYSFQLTYDIRLSVNENHAEFESWINNVLMKAGEGCSVSFIRKEPQVAPTEVDNSNQFWLELKTAVEKLGHRLITAPNPGSNDARHFRSMNVPVLGFSPIKNTPYLAHAHDEYITEKVFLEGIEVYKKVISGFTSIPSNLKY